MLSKEELKKAARLNRLYADSLTWTAGGVPQRGWGGRLTQILTLLDMTAQTNDEYGFAQAVANWQEKNGISPVDGIIGTTTWAKMEPLTRGSGVTIQLSRPKILGNPIEPGNRGVVVSGSPTGSGTISPASGYLFVVFEQLPEVGSKHLIRKVGVVPKNFALRPANPKGILSLGQHALGESPKLSQFLSASNRPMGSASIFPRPGQPATPVLLDTAKIRAAGGQIFSPEDIVKDLRRIAAQNPQMKTRIDLLIDTVSKIEGEVLIEGGTPPHSGKPLSMAHKKYVTAGEALWSQLEDGTLTRGGLKQGVDQLDDAYRSARNVGRVGRVVTGVGLVFTVIDVKNATVQSIEQKSFKPIGAETIRQVGGWGAGIAGSKIGFVVGATFGIETGPGAIVTGAVGALIVGTAGYFGADWVADLIHEN